MNDQLQDICLSQGLPIYRPAGNSDAIEVIATGDYPMASHWFKIFERNNGQIGVILEFPTCQTGEIERVEEFCEIVTENFFGSSAHLYFDTAARHFFLGSFAEKKTLASHLTSLAFGCDVVIPLCELVGRQGWWNEASIDLALFDRSDPGSA
jgi:hypothetical protein